MIQERIKREFKAIKLPEIFNEENRGYYRCCKTQLVLASESNDTWKSDITPSWIKLSDPADSVQFVLKKCGEITNYIPTSNEFINEPNAFFTQIEWIDVLNSDGPGIYTLNIVANISGIPFDFQWGVYNLLEFSIENALYTARIKAVFNSYHEIEGIDFTNSNVIGTFRFYGVIGSRQPNKQIDNIIFDDRQMSSVVRENLNIWELKTDPTNEEVTKIITDLYLLSENRLFISDYNAHNHSYRINDIPVILEETDELEYIEDTREAVLKAKFSDKFKDKRTYFK